MTAPLPQHAMRPSRKVAGGWRVGTVAMAVMASLFASGCQPDEPAATTEISAPPAAAPQSLAALLEANNWRYVLQDGKYTVVLSNDLNDVAISCGEGTMYTDPTGRPVKIIWLWTQLASLPDGVQPSPALLLKIAETNDGLRPGNVSLNPQNNKIYYNSALWLDTATPQTLYDELAYAFHRKTELQRVLLPYLEEE